MVVGIAGFLRGSHGDAKERQQPHGADHDQQEAEHLDVVLRFGNLDASQHQNLSAAVLFLLVDGDRGNVGTGRRVVQNARVTVAVAVVVVVAVVRPLPSMAVASTRVVASVAAGLLFPLRGRHHHPGLGKEVDDQIGRVQLVIPEGVLVVGEHPAAENEALLGGRDLVDPGGLSLEGFDGPIGTAGNGKLFLGGIENDNGQVAVLFGCLAFGFVFVFGFVSVLFVIFMVGFRSGGLVCLRDTRVRVRVDVVINIDINIDVIVGNTRVIPTPEPSVRRG
mmetsp:Transcript_21608/g.60059  ORF Transcript_21608/g.60059 Transcript_21608/m.60059 type:complete len:278 (+) Transcript_21608:804-1637(+)